MSKPMRNPAPPGGLDLDEPVFPGEIPVARTMLIIRRMETRTGGFTVLMLPPDYRKVIRTDEREHNEILRLYKQDRRYRDIENDFTDFDLDPDTPPA